MFGLTLFLSEQQQEKKIITLSSQQVVRIKKNTNPGRLFSSKIVYRVLRGTCNSEFRFKKLAL